VRQLSDEYVKNIIDNGRRVGTDTLTDLLQQEDVQVTAWIEENPTGGTLRGEMSVTIPLIFCGAIDGLLTGGTE
jgi:hypothetical protein